MCNLSQGIREDALEERTKDIAERMIRGDEPDWKIIDYTGLTEEQVKALREEMKTAVMA